MDIKGFIGSIFITACVVALPFYIAFIFFRKTFDENW